MDLTSEELDTIIGWYKHYVFTIDQPITEIEIQLAYKLLAEYNSLHNLDALGRKTRI